MSSTRLMTPPDPPRLSAGRALPVAPQALTLSVARGCDLECLTPGSLDHPHLSMRPLEPLTRSACCRRRLKPPTARLPERLGKARPIASFTAESPCRAQSEHPFATLRNPPGQGAGLLASLPFISDLVQARCRQFREDASHLSCATDVLSRSPAGRSTAERRTLILPLSP